MIHKKLTYVEFEVLTQLANEDIKPTYLLKNSLPKNLKSQFNKTLDNLDANNYLKNHQNHIRITSKGVEVLEQYKVKRAVILAAGKGTRMRPETQNTPKPMVRVGNKRIIETQIDALHKAGITDITIVRGYLSHKFDVLLDTYPNLKFVDNPHWESAGAIVSVSYIVDLLEGAYLIEGDLFIESPGVFRQYEYQSFYCGINDDVIDDWHFVADKTLQIKKLAHGSRLNKHKDNYKFVGIMHWVSKEAFKIKQDLEKVLQDSTNHQRFIESVPFDEQTGDYKIYARQISEGSVIEIDTFLELQTLRQKLNN